MDSHSRHSSALHAQEPRSGKKPQSTTGVVVASSTVGDVEAVGPIGAVAGVVAPGISCWQHIDYIAKIGRLVFRDEVLTLLFYSQHRCGRASWPSREPFARRPAFSLAGKPKMAQSEASIPVHPENIG